LLLLVLVVSCSLQILATVKAIELLSLAPYDAVADAEQYGSELASYANGNFSNSPTPLLVVAGLAAEFVQQFSQSGLLFQSELLLTLLCLSSCILLFAIVYLSHRSQPLLHSGQTRRFIQAPYDSFRVEQRVDELMSLISSFNQLVQELRQTRQVLANYSQELEQKVRERTQVLEQEICRRAAVEAILQQTNQGLEQLAFMDGLTQTANRRYFDQRLYQEWRRLRRIQAPLTVILCDIDYFKQYNDTYGHRAGDRCLREVAAVLQAAAKRSADVVARYGGEEFALILPDTPATGAIQMSCEIQAAIRRLQIPHQGSLGAPYVTLSLGIASAIPQGSMVPEQLIDHADRSLYQAKSKGRDCIVVDQLTLETCNLQLV
jgi:diguanylate cyclase (GGDEF)-like protein